MRERETQTDRIRGRKTRERGGEMEGGKERGKIILLFFIFLVKIELIPI